MRFTAALLPALTSVVAIQGSGNDSDGLEQESLLQATLSVNGLVDIDKPLKGGFSDDFKQCAIFLHRDVNFCSTCPNCGPCQAACSNKDLLNCALFQHRDKNFCNTCPLCGPSHYPCTDFCALGEDWKMPEGDGKKPPMPKPDDGEKPMPKLPEDDGKKPMPPDGGQGGEKPRYPPKDAGCPPGQHAVAGATTCYACPAGKYSEGGLKYACVDCPVGRYMDLAGMSQCTDCPTAPTDGQPGSTECDGKKPMPPMEKPMPPKQGPTPTPATPARTPTSATGGCPPGKRAVQHQNGWGNTCEDCAAGSYSETGVGLEAVGMTGVAHCPACPIGKYTDLAGMSDCKVCPSAPPRHVDCEDAFGNPLNAVR